MPSGYRKGESRVPHCDGGKRLPPLIASLTVGTCTLKVCAGYFQQKVPAATGVFSLVPGTGDANRSFNEPAELHCHRFHGVHVALKPHDMALLQNTVELRSFLISENKSLI